MVKTHIAVFFFKKWSVQQNNCCRTIMLSFCEMQCRCLARQRRQWCVLQWSLTQWRASQSHVTRKDARHRSAVQMMLLMMCVSCKFEDRSVWRQRRASTMMRVQSQAYAAARGKYAIKRRDDDVRQRSVSCNDETHQWRHLCNDARHKSRLCCCQRKNGYAYAQWCAWKVTLTMLRVKSHVDNAARHKSADDMVKINQRLWRAS
jgi:hypothetical protein